MAYQPDQTQTLLWHDYETFGIDPKFDRIAQFAAIRTDLDFNPIDVPMMWYCQPADDYLPSPAACLLTGITPQKAHQEGLPEVEFMARINEVMSQPGTCVVGYNNLRFDDEFTRYGLYRNFMDAYAREWQGGNSRWDLIDLARATAVLRPEGINWPINEDHQLVFKLDQLAPANGIEHADAHDALADVRATISFAKLLLKEQPRIYNYAFQLKHKTQVWGQLSLTLKKPILHISGMYGRDKGNMALVAVFMRHPSNKNSVLAYDLRTDPCQWQDKSVEELNQAIFLNKHQNPDQVRLPVKEIHVNRCPFIAPANTIDEATAAKYTIDHNASLQHLQWLSANPAFCHALGEAYTLRPPLPVEDVDAALYGGGFFSDHDRQAMQRVHETAPNNWHNGEFAFSDKRLPSMLTRMKSRCYPESLTATEAEQWEAFRYQRLLKNPPQGVRSFVEFSQELHAQAELHQDQHSQTVLQDLATYAESIYPHE